MENTCKCCGNLTSEHTTNSERSDAPTETSTKEKHTPKIIELREQQDKSSAATTHTAQEDAPATSAQEKKAEELPQTHTESTETSTEQTEENKYNFKKATSSAKKAFAHSRETAIALVKNPTFTMHESNRLSITTCFTLLILQCVSIMLCLFSLRSKVYSTLPREGLPSLNNQIISYAILVVLFTAAFAYFCILLSGKLFQSKTMQPVALFTTISKASIPYTIFFICCAVLIFIWPRMQDTLFQGAILFMLIFVSTYSLYLLEMGLRLQVPNATVRIAMLSLAISAAIILSVSVLGHLVHEDVQKIVTQFSELL